MYVWGRCDFDRMEWNNLKLVISFRDIHLHIDERIDACTFPLFALSEKLRVMSVSVTKNISESTNLALSNSFM